MKGMILLVIMLYGHIAYAKDNARLHGIIKHPLADSVVLSYSVPSMDYMPTVHSSKIAEDGSFNITCEVPTASIRAYLMNGEQHTELYLSPAADLSVYIDGNNFDSSVHYEGKGKEVANFLAHHVLELSTMQSFAIKVQGICDKEIKEYKIALKEKENKELLFLQKHGENLTAAFKEYYKSYYHYMVYAAMESYPRVHEMIKQQTNDFPVIPKETYAIINDIPLEFNDKDINNEGYFSYVTNLFYLKLVADNPAFDTTDNVALKRDSIFARSYRSMPPLTAEFHLGRSVYIYLNYTSMGNTEAAFRKYKTAFPRSKYLPELEHAIWAKKAIGIGKPAVDFDITTPEGKKMKLSDLKGNVIYLDFWNRSCAPCIAEISKVKKIKEYFKDKPVRFVYVSIDNDETWRTAIRELQIEGIHTRDAGSYTSDLQKKYSVIGFPTYYIIDKEGKFASVENVLRPSSGEKLINKIETLLKK